MKKLLILPLLTILLIPVCAQNWVTIPDANFADKLNEQFPECMDGNQMNTECEGIINATNLFVQADGISDLTGLEYFVNLEELRCNNNSLTELPELPASLTILLCFYNNLTSLPQLPSTLSVLRCYGNDITELPELPQSLTVLNCSSNDISPLPDVPPSLIQLYCSANSLTVLPELPETLELLWCYENALTTLPELPQSLINLRCYGNPLSFLPELPPSLQELRCNNNTLNTLPELPESLTDLYCYNNNFTTLPELPQSLTRLWCYSNDLTCLPELPMSLTDSTNFHINNNPFTCLPNYVPAMGGPNNSVWLTYPLCGLGDLENNPYDCSSANGIAGTVYEDLNGDCVENEAENGVINATLQLLNEFDELVATANTFGSGENILYNFAANPGTYTVQLVTENMPFQTSCDPPGDSQEVELSTDDPSVLNVNFGVECLPGFDVGVQSVMTTGWVFPGQVHTLKIAAGAMSNWFGMQCNADVSGTVTVSVDGPVSYVGPATSALTPNVIGELQFSYDIADFGDVNFQQDFGLRLSTNTSAQVGELVCVDISVDPIVDDVNPVNNTHNQCYELVNSYDPNIKQVWPQNVEPGYDGYFSYTIYFQNTGTAPAFNIRVADTLDTNLDLNTFEVTAYSHPCLTYVSGDVATFRFNNIMLPDSTSDFDGSIGYVQYRIKPVSDLPVGTVIENTAHIFFDFNDAIVTNTTQNEFVIDTSTDHLQKQIATVFPNPGTGQFNVLFSRVETGITTQLEVYNLSGQRVLQEQVNENRVVLDLTGYPSGMYLLHVRNENGSDAVKLMKH